MSLLNPCDLLGCSNIIYIYIYINAVYFANLLKSQCFPSFSVLSISSAGSEPPRLGRRDWEGDRDWERDRSPRLVTAVPACPRCR